MRDPSTFKGMKAMNTGPSGHTVRSFDTDLQRLTEVLVEMGCLALRQVSEATRALMERDDALAAGVLDREPQLNDYDLLGEEVAMQLIARRQPMGVDLRSIIVLLKSFTELERAGDEAKKIAKITRRLIVEGSDPIAACRDSFARMSAAACEAIEQVLEAVRTRDEQLAIRVADADTQLDLEYKAALRAVQEGLASDPANVPMVTEAVLILKAVERIGDHAKNLAKHMIFQIEGIDIRHLKGQSLAEALGKADPQNPAA
ncbi:MAG TPA: phosphate signaling complex protein PhoU [Thioalkalivibrio sp.]|nr:phosphate signaling complex protein PhoU [Thioalkalivibrio sp.]